MKLLLPVVFQFIVFFSCAGQNPSWLFYDQKNGSIHTIRDYKDDLLLIIDGPAYNSPAKPSFKVLDKSGNILKEVILKFPSESNAVYLNQLDSNFLLTFVDFDFEGQHEIRYVSRLFNYELEILQDTSMKMTNRWCKPTPFGSCTIGSFQTLFKADLNKNYIVGNMGFQNDSSQLFMSRYDDKGYFQSFYINENRWERASYLNGAAMEVFPQTDSTFYLNNGGSLELRDYNLKRIKFTDYTGYNIDQFRPWTIVDMERTADSSYVFFSGNWYPKPMEWADLRKFTLGKFDKNLKYQYLDTVEIPSYFHGEDLESFLHAAFNKGVMKEPDGSYISILSYSNDVSGDTSSSRILVIKYDENLNVICQQTFIARDYDIIIRDLTRDKNGDYYAAILYGTREFQYLDIGGTIIKIGNDCTIDGMENIQEYLGELSTSKINELYGIRLWQNPIDNKLVIHAERSFPPGDPTIDIYDFSGKLIIESKAHINGTMASISAEQLTNGLYIYQMKVDGTLIGVGKFVKK